MCVCLYMCVCLCVFLCVQCMFACMFVWMHVCGVCVCVACVRWCVSSSPVHVPLILCVSGENNVATIPQGSTSIRVREVTSDASSIGQYRASSLPPDQLCITFYIHYHSRGILSMYVQFIHVTAHA